MFHTVHLHISYGPYDRLRYQDAGRSTWNVQKGVKTKVMTLCKHFPKLYMQSEVNSDVLGQAGLYCWNIPLCPRILSPADASYMSCPSVHTLCPPTDVSYIFAFLRKFWRPFFIKVCNSSSLFTSSPSSTVCKVQIRCQPSYPT